MNRSYYDDDEEFDDEKTPLTGGASSRHVTPELREYNLHIGTRSGTLCLIFCAYPYNIISGLGC